MANTEDPDEPLSSQESQDSHESRKPTRSTRSTKRAESTRTAKRPTAMEILRQARGQLAELTGMEAESVTSFEQTDEGWSLEVEVLELERVPDTMSLMASYQVELDSDGQLTGYRRVRRYERGRSDARRSGGR
ncbi:gas vesicle protein [Streptomyces sp. SBST2-5]|uniref:Gas vesicle protein n=1 Tax=Streptomyces composti TaxID=2720025 RepID=A0ABX1AEY2_9ACTN|nr:gas vesicle protein [Streptomyces composti]NJP53021.1 gas vesicle protein [Streptomyces composti]